MKTIKELAKEAIQVQTASNLSGLVKRWAEVTNELRAQTPQLSTEDFNRHPINCLWASKMHELTRMGISDLDAYERAYKACEQLAAH